MAKNFDLNSELYSIARQNFHRPVGLIASAALLALVLLTIYKILIPSDIIPFRDYSYFMILCEGMLFISWLAYKYNYPLKLDRKFGVIIAIQVEDETRDLTIYRNDFLNPLISKLNCMEHPIKARGLPNHQAEQINEESAAQKLLKRTGNDFCLWGILKKRPGAAGDRYVLTLYGKIANQALTLALKEEVSYLISDQYIFEEKVQVEHFAATSNALAEAIDYIVGKTAFLSGNIEAAIKLHEGLYNSLKGKHERKINPESLKSLLAMEYDALAATQYSKNKPYKSSVEKALHYDPKYYGGLLKKAIITFDEGRGDARNALVIVNQAKSYSDGYHWLYSKAFLHLWLNEFDLGLQCCEQLAGITYNDEETTIKEVITFNQKLLNAHSKPQLHFWLGFIYYKKTKNTKLARKYLETFLNTSNDSSMNLLRQEAQKYVAEINGHP